MKTILITCGETSGDHHAARLVSAIRSRDPEAGFIAMGGDELAASGARIRYPISEYAFMGFSEIITGLPRIRRLEKDLGDLLAGGGIDLFIPVDYPGFNMRMARRAKDLGIPVLYFISPQVWAWAGWRTKRMRKVVDLMAVILPFEVEYYRRRSIPVFFAGHPMVDEISSPPGPKQAPDEGEHIRILLFPGSRRQEVARHIGPMLGAARALKKEWPRCSFRLCAAPLIDEKFLEVPGDMRDYVTITREGVEELGAASLVVASSGTVTLQTALSGTPMVVVYRTSWPTYLLARSMVRLEFIAMPNILAGGKLVPELIQGGAEASNIAEEAGAILSNGERYTKISAGLLSLRESLTRPGGLDRLSGIALEMAGGEYEDQD
jgi:lipid-A-disaccharide synthase